MSYANLFAANLVSAQHAARDAQDAELRRTRRARGRRGRPVVEPEVRASRPLRAPTLPAGLVPRFGQAGQSPA